MCVRLLCTANHSMDGAACETGMEPLMCEIQSHLMVPWWGINPWQANTRNQSKLLFWKRCRRRSPDRYLAQARKHRAWGFPRACVPWSLSFLREGLVSAMLVSFGHLRPQAEHCLSAAGRQLPASSKTGRLSRHQGQVARCCTTLARMFLLPPCTEVTVMGGVFLGLSTGAAPWGNCHPNG